MAARGGLSWNDVPRPRSKKLPCRYFNGKKGSCIHGDNCEYAHVSTKKKEVCKYYNGKKGSCMHGNTCKYLHENTQRMQTSSEDTIKLQKDNTTMSYIAMINNMTVFMMLFRENLIEKLKTRMAGLNTIYKNCIDSASKAEEYLLMIVDCLHKSDTLNQKAKDGGFSNIQELIETVFPKLYTCMDPLLWKEQQLTHMDDKTSIISLITIIISFRPIPHIGVLQINPITRQGGSFPLQNMSWSELMDELYDTIPFSALVRHIVDQFPEGSFYKPYNEINDSRHKSTYNHLVRIINLTMVRIFQHMVDKFVNDPLQFTTKIYHERNGLVISKEEATIISKLIPARIIPSLIILFNEMNLIVDGRHLALGFIWDQSNFSDKENESISIWFMLYYYAVMQNNVENNYGDRDIITPSTDYHKNNCIMAHVAESIFTVSKLTKEHKFTHSKYRGFIDSLFKNCAHSPYDDKPNERLCRIIISLIKYYNGESVDNDYWKYIEKRFSTSRESIDTIDEILGEMNISKEGKLKLFKLLHNKITGKRHYNINVQITESSPCTILYPNAQMHIMKQLEKAILQLFPTYNDQDDGRA
ncbi:MAG: hypothetical protein LWX54_03180 [Deltaproteobacteria bacterium]|jgi:hypothetical protein|nr:hypothetical protein [Deltaproteobacteria bacterium]